MRSLYLQVALDGGCWMVAVGWWLLDGGCWMVAVGW